MPTATNPIFFVVDDNDPLLTYSGSGWTTDMYGGLDELGDWGPPYLHTLHGISGEGSVSFRFNGSYIHAFASFGNTAKGSIPEWKCLVDGIAIANQDPPDSPNNNWEICNSAATDLSQSMHNFTIEVKAAEKNSTFWLDWIAYVPSMGFFLDRTTVIIPPEDTSILYDASWRPWDPYGMMGTAREGSSAVVKFFGAAISWYGFLDGTTTPSTGRGSYTIDSGSPTSFTWASHKNHTTYRHLFFTTPGSLKPGPHQLKVTFHGSSPNLIPLSLSQLNIDVRPLPAMTTAAVPVIHPTRIQAIYGGVLGGLSAIFLIGVLGGVLFWLRREHLQRHKKSDLSGRPSPTSAAEPPPSADSGLDDRNENRRQPQGTPEIIPLYIDVRRHRDSDTRASGVDHPIALLRDDRHRD